MSINLDAIRSRLNKLQNTSKKVDRLWKPSPGKTQIRIVPYRFNKDNPFIELYFHYNVNNKSYLSPISFGRPDPIVEFADKLKRMGDKDDWRAARQMEPRLRTFVPVLVRGEESEGVRFWGFGKTVYQEILGYIADPDYGDITDPLHGRDITIEYVSAEDAGTSYPVTTIRVKPKESALDNNPDKIKEYIAGQSNITDIYQELSYDELKDILDKWLNPTEEDGTDLDQSVTQTVLSKTEGEGSPATDSTPPTPVASDVKSADNRKKLDDITSSFDDLFNS